MQYYQVFISAEDVWQASKILDALVGKKLILGGPILQGPAKHWFKGKIEEMPYCYILTFTKTEYKDKVIEAAREASGEDFPQISFIPAELNQELADLIDAHI